MKIIKRGSTRVVKRLECAHCGTIFEADNSETRCTIDDDGSWTYIDCPLESCRRSIGWNTGTVVEKPDE